MKKIIAIAALAVVAACSQAETEPEAVATEEAVEVAPVMAADGLPPAGTYRVTDPDGVVHEEVLLEDGTFTSTAPDGTVTRGTWNQKASDTYCYTEEGAEEVCNTEGIDANGVWTSTGPDGKSATVERVTAEAATENAA